APGKRGRTTGPGHGASPGAGQRKKPAARVRGRLDAWACATGLAGRREGRAQYRRWRLVTSREARRAWRFTAAAALRLGAWVGFSYYSRLRVSARAPAFSQVRLKRRRAKSKGSFSRTLTLGIRNLGAGWWPGLRASRVL